MRRETHEGQAKKSARKRQLRAANMAILAAEASARGMTVDALVAERYREAEQIRAGGNSPLVVRVPAPEMRPAEKTKSYLPQGLVTGR